jgi:glutamate/tyrosine decarboxylase-like PLP-dependent enzyme
MAATLDKETLKLLADAVNRLEMGFAHLPAAQASAPGCARLPAVLRETADRLRDNFPYFHPLYAGQMLKPPHPVARLAYSLALWVNPNNHALDGGRASSAMEKEAVAEIAAMFGWRTLLGHLCGGGTMANLEALWVAGEIHPGRTIVASEQAHYTHKRISKVLKLGFDEVACDACGRMDVRALEGRLAGGEVGSVVATMGTTATGAVDPLEEILQLRGKYGFRVHADAAYGGYFVLTDNLEASTRRAFASLEKADSIVVDPHKHGLQPYGCGCVLFRDAGVGRFYRHESPYTYFSSPELHLGEISLECSRPGATAVALWATQRLLPLVKGGEFARGLERGRGAALALYERLKSDGAWFTSCAPELDIVVFAPRVPRPVNQAIGAAEISRASRKVFKQAAERGLHLALVDLPVKFFPDAANTMAPGAGTITCLRSVLMKPEHADWVDRIWEILSEAARGICA